MTAPLTIGAVTRHFAQLFPQANLRPWQVRRLFERGLLPEPPRVGAYRVIDSRDLPKVREALVRAGYLPVEVTHAR